MTNDTLPDTFTARMTRTDMRKGWSNIYREKKICEFCPVAEVLHRLYPEYRWSVGTDVAYAHDKSDQDKYASPLSRRASYQFDEDTRRWIAHYGSEPDNLTNPDVAPLESMVFTRIRVQKENA